MMRLFLSLAIYLGTCCAQGIIGPIANLPPNEYAVPGQYVLSFERGVSNEKVDRVRDVDGVTVVREIRIDDWEALVIRLDGDEVVNRLLGLVDAGIASLTQDHKVHAIAAFPQDANPPSSSSCAAALPSLTTDTDAPHGLYQISHLTVPASGAKDNSTFIFDQSAGKDTCAYIIDSGIRPDHSEFTGRIEKLYDCIGASNRTSDPSTKGCKEVPTSDMTFDQNGHGTHVAGTVAGTNYGVARNAKLIGLRVLDASGAGALSDMLAAIELAAAHASTASGDGTCSKGTACNISLGTNLVGTVLSRLLGSPAVSAAVDAAADAGLFCAIAAGNDDFHVQTAEPANAPHGCTVGALDERNKKACFSNWGSGVDVWAPGVKVLSASNSGSDATAVLSGTSMAAPHVAGLKLYFDSLCGSPNVRKPPKDACKYLRDRGSEFGYITTKTGSLTLQLGLPICPAVPDAIQSFLQLLGIADLVEGKGKTVFNGGNCACENW